MAIIGLQKGSGKKVESQGKVSEKSGNFDMDNEWQPCIIVCFGQFISLLMI